MFLQHIVDADIEMKRLSESVERQSVDIVNLNDMKIASDNKSQRDDKGIRDDMRISVPNKSRETVPKTYSISDNVTSTDVRKTLLTEVPETPAIMSNISVDISAEQTIKSYSDTVRNDDKFQQVKKKSGVVYGKSTKNPLRAAPEVHHAFSQSHLFVFVTASGLTCVNFVSNVQQFTYC